MQSNAKSKAMASKAMSSNVTLLDIAIAVQSPGAPLPLRSSPSAVRRCRCALRRVVTFRV